MKPTLFVLAAGMGSRYGGLKQLDGLGPNGETIMDYSIYDAIRSGFGKLVFVIREYFEADFRHKIISKYENHIPVEVVFQELDKLPQGFSVPQGREKPWGTNHAVLMGKEVIHEPFAVINADDFYGRQSYAVLGEALKEMEGKQNQYCMVGYRIGNTLSESGLVARGVCETNAENELTGVVERTAIGRIDGEIRFTDESGATVTLEENTPVSMNMWGFTPDYFQYSEAYLADFLKANQANLKSEYFIPLMVNELVTKGKAKVKVLDTTAKWFGVTYAADRQGVVNKIKALVDAGEYPAKLF
ncbi:MAG: nucleotidyltransferase [Tannerellaceae bacterium]|jgi:dTDP-glucose pyrophosphorylase|nr:nucleotidyltransferase [Tannerellaceae bacterium]